MAIDHGIGACEHCGKAYPRRRWFQKYCGADCKTAAFRKRHGIPDSVRGLPTQVRKVSREPWS